MPLYPVFLDLRGRRVLLFGGDALAARKAEALLAAGATVEVHASRLDPSFATWSAAGRLHHHSAPFDEAVLDGAWFVLIREPDPELRDRIATAAARRGIWVNVVDDAVRSSAQLPARIERGPIQIALNSRGRVPILLRRLRARLETALEPELAVGALWLAAQRQRLQAAGVPASVRRRILERLLDGPAWDAVRTGRWAEAEAAARQAEREVDTAAAGMVILVGAGPGDPGLLTLAGFRALQRADVILHDRLVSAEVLALARREAERIDVGKQAGGHATAQAEIHRLLIERARAGQTVVRLKGGDPFVFGRGGEELEALRQAGIRYQVVPGITAALACAAYAGIPLTHREHAQSLCLVTAHCQRSLEDLDWPSLARARQTLALYMGVANLDRVRALLLGHGRAATTPYALIERGSQVEQRVILGVLADLPERARRYAVRAPALLLVGEVTALAAHLHWFGAPPRGVDHPPAPATDRQRAVPRERTHRYRPAARGARQPASAAADGPGRMPTDRGC